MIYAEVDPTAVTTRDGVVIRSAWADKALLEKVPGAHYDGRARTWRAPLTWAAAVALRGVFGDAFTYGPNLAAWLTTERATRVDPATFLRDQIAWPDGWPRELLPTDVDPGLMPFQVAGAYWLLLARQCVLGDDMGCGKTVQILTALRWLGDAGLPALVTCPNGVKRHWARLAGRWCPDARPYVVAGTPKQKDQLLREARRDPRALVVINIEQMRAFSRLAPYGSIKLRRCRRCDPRHGEPDLTPARCEVHPKVLNDFPFRTAVIDEAHHILHPRAKWTRAVWAAFHNPSITYRWGATGTLIGNEPSEMWSIYHALAPDEWPVKSTWMDRYALMSWTAGGGTDVVGLRPDTKRELFMMFDPRYRRMLKDVVLPQLPPLTEVRRDSEMTTAQRRMYAELARTHRTRTETGRWLLTPSALVARTRLMQIAAGTVDVQVPDGCDPNELTSWVVKIKDATSKLDELERVVEELGDRPFVVAVEHRDVVQLVSERLTKLGVTHGYIMGGISEYERDQQLQLLRAGRIRAIVFTIAAGKEGIDMSCVDTMIRLQRPNRLISHLQTRDRIRRKGSEVHASLTVVDVVTPGTVEEDQLVRLAQRAEMLDEVQRDREARHRAGLSTTDQDRLIRRLLDDDVFTELPQEETIT